MGGSAGEGSTRCGSRCRTAGRRLVSRRASPVYAAFCAAARGGGDIKKVLCGHGWHNERAHASAANNKWHEEAVGVGKGCKYAQMV